MMYTTQEAMNRGRAPIDSKNYVASDRLPDGRSIHIRAIRPDDKSVLVEGMHHLSKKSRYFRFMTAKKQLTKDDLVYFTELDFGHHVGLLALVAEGDAEIPAGVGRFIRSSTDAQTAELAFAVIEEYQGLGIAALLLKHLVAIGRAEGVAEFSAVVLSENRRMQSVFQKSELPMKQVCKKGGEIEIRLDLK